MQEEQERQKNATSLHSQPRLINLNGRNDDPNIRGYWVPRKNMILILYKFW